TGLRPANPELTVIPPQSCFSVLPYSLSSFSVFFPRPAGAGAPPFISWGPLLSWFPERSGVYKLLLCWRYLRTRYLAMVCIVSVMLGVATLIVVNSVMGGFSTKLKQRLHGLLSDVVIEAQNGGTFDDPEGKMTRIRSDPFLAEHVEAMTPVHETFAMLIGEGPVPNTRPV